ncbi:MAG: family 43 glycosylhydrolase [Myxococcales bacterium]|nr:family 43 glycosylhydrolase [Myxococcales bacterium]
MSRVTRPRTATERLALVLALLVACATEGPTRDATVDSRADTSSDQRAPSNDGNATIDAVDELPTPRDDGGFDGGSPTDARIADSATDVPRSSPDAAAPIVATNPVLGEDHPDPHVVRTTDASGRVVYYLYATAGFGDFVPWESRDLVRWTRRSEGLFRRTTTAPNSLEINGGHYCHLWAPDVVEVRPGVWMLSFSAVKHRTAQRPCPPYREDGGVYFASSASPTGPFALAERPWEPLAAGGHNTSCLAPTRDQIPHSVPFSAQDCQGGFCHHIVRLDSAAFRDPLTGRWWLGYSWYTNTPPRVPWEESNYGQHTNLVELDGADPFTVRCTTSVPQIHVGNPHDANTLARLRSSCARCGEMLSFTRARDNVDFRREGFVFGVNEGVHLFRRGALVYALLSGSVWDSGYYNVWYAAAPTPEGLAFDNASRIVGRFLIPNRGQSFGHGTAVLGPNGRDWYYVHHRLQADRCRTSGNCARDVWLSPIEFEDRRDGRGDVWIRTRFPAEDPRVTVSLP